MYILILSAQYYFMYVIHVQYVLIITCMHIHKHVIKIKITAIVIISLTNIRYSVHVPSVHCPCMVAASVRTAPVASIANGDDESLGIDGEILVAALEVELDDATIAKLNL